MTTHRLSTVRALLDDPGDMARFLATIPNSASLSRVLQERHVLSTRAYDDETEIARFVRSDGVRVICLEVPGVTIDEAEMIAAQCELLDEWSDETLARAVHLALADDDALPHEG